MNQMLDLVFPPTCLLCNAQVMVAHSLCPFCWSKITFIAKPFSAICGVPFPVVIEDENICYLCLMKKPEFMLARAVVRFNDTTVKLIHNFKYYDRQDYVVWMTALMSKYREEELISSVIIAGGAHAL